MSKKKIKPKLSKHQTDLLQISKLKNSMFLNSWEKDFVNSLDKSTAQGKELSIKQRYHLGKIYGAAKQMKRSPISSKGKVKNLLKNNVPRKSIITPPKDTILYNGITPPWENKND